MYSALSKGFHRTIKAGEDWRLLPASRVPQSVRDSDVHGTATSWGAIRSCAFVDATTLRIHSSFLPAGQIFEKYDKLRIFRRHRRR